MLALVNGQSKGCILIQSNIRVQNFHYFFSHDESIFTIRTYYHFWKIMWNILYFWTYCFEIISYNHYSEKLYQPSSVEKKNLLMQFLLIGPITTKEIFLFSLLLHEPLPIHYLTNIGNISGEVFYFLFYFYFFISTQCFWFSNKEVGLNFDFHPNPHQYIYIYIYTHCVLT